MSFELNGEDRNEIEGLKDDHTKPPFISLEELEIDCEGEPVLEELLRDMVNHCLSYTITVAKFKRIVANVESWDEARKEIDQVRKNSHDAMIASVNSFSRGLADHHRDNSWVGELKGERIQYTKFALTLTLSRI